MGASCTLLKVLVLVLVQVFVLVGSSPVGQNQTQEQPAPRSADASLHYNKYLQQVVLYLEKDPHFREKLRNANISDITDGRLSQELDFVHHSVRTKLDELKREEISRLRMLLKARRDLNRHGRVKELLLKHFDHLDFSNNLFEVQDLDRLIRAATKDLQAVDQQQHEAFKRYEMLKEHERRQRLKTMSREEREHEEREREDRRRKHQQHAKVNQPGSEDQLKEVWQETDGLDEQDFNPKTFFKLHDSNQDGFWDEDELEALFTKELEKVYDPQNEEDDLMEMQEERLRMREHMIQKVDTDRDGLVSEQEFIDSSKTEEFHQNQEWETVDQAPFFSEQELAQFEEHLSEEHQKIFTKTEELQRQRQELEEQQRVLDSHREELQQAWQQLDKLKEQKQPWDQHPQEDMQKSSPEPRL